MARKSRTLLNVEECSAELRAISRRNASESSFLLLPAEIRNQIYKHAFGGDTQRVRVSSKPGRYPVLSARRCKCELSEQQMIEHYKMNGDIEIFPDHYYGEEKEVTDCHTCCHDRQPDCLNLALLGVCRQVYDEAALLPYSTNEFILDTSHYAFSNFTSTLLPAQRKAITRIALVGDTLPNVQLGWPRTLIGVKSLSLRISLAHAPSWTGPRRSSWELPLNPSKKALLKSTRPLARFPVDSASVLVTWCRNRDGENKSAESELEKTFKRPFHELSAETRAARQTARIERREIAIATQRAKLESGGNTSPRTKVQQMTDWHARRTAAHSRRLMKVHQRTLQNLH
ncbi:hypothetical protein CBER1_03744 [Cercospora berteroae]|uniref:DUF7730 domain-containing protein n=1 Tax=Cercospora berteroae TaxID=357750 RepID=A0A2S6C799_9PEZI|nr:hypothetical protein CBER1_03744 [Cercospora berteroae]